VLRPLAYLTAEEPELAADLASQCDSNWAGVVMGTELGDLSYASTRFDPLWDILSKEKLPLFIHPGSSPDKRLDAFYLTNLLGNPIETTLAVSNLIFGQVMHRFPDLKVILAHGGGCIAALCGRWQRGGVTNRPGIPKLPLPPIEAVRRLYVDSIAHSSAYLAAIIETVGADHVLLGSDWPFPMGTPNADHDLGHLDASLRRLIRNRNAERVFGSRLRARPSPERSGS
jgi:aminocarboxymuconate-semialdehyde decarboxylase